MCIVLNIFKFGAVQFFEDTLSATIEAVVRLQPRCSEKIERDSGLISFTTRLLVPTSRIGCLIGKGGSITSRRKKSIAEASGHLRTLAPWKQEVLFCFLRNL